MYPSILPVEILIKSLKLELLSFFQNSEVNMNWTPRYLSKIDELATALIVDPYLGKITHKMDSNYKPVFDDAILKTILKNFMHSLAYDETYESYLELIKKKEIKIEAGNLERELVSG